MKKPIMTYSKVYCLSGCGENDCKITLSDGITIDMTRNNGLNSIEIFFCKVNKKRVSALKCKWVVIFREHTRSPNSVEKFRMKVLDRTKRPRILQTENYVGNRHFPNYPYHRTLVGFANTVVEVWGPGKFVEFVQMPSEEIEKWSRSL